MEPRADDTPMSFFEHVEALRPHLVRGAAAIVLCGVVAFLCKDFVVDTLLFGPQRADFPTYRWLQWIAKVWNGAMQGVGESLCVAVEEFRGVEGLRIINTSLAGQFNLHMKISFFAGLSLAMPYVLWEFWRFVRPALTPAEKNATRHFVFWVSACFFSGLLFGYFVMAPLSVNFFAGYRVSEQIENLFDIGNYLSLVLTVTVSCALLFELPLLIYYLTRMGLLSSSLLCRYRRHAFVVLLVVSAVITPPDVFSLLLVIIPFYGLYELGIRLARHLERRG